MLTAHEQKRVALNHQVSKLIDAGLSIIPLRGNKTPAIRWKKHQKRPSAKYEYGYESGYVGMICGKVSGNVEVIDFDLKYDLTGTLMQDYAAIVRTHDAELISRLVWQQTTSGGYHAIYRSAKIEGNRKLAMRPTIESERKSPTDKKRVLIETRGEKGYIAVAPSPKYKIIKGSLLDIPVIEPYERDLLIDAAKSFNQIVRPVRKASNHTSKVNRTEQNGIIYRKGRKGDIIDLFAMFDRDVSCLTVLEWLGWSFVLEDDRRQYVKRSGDTTADFSGNIDTETNRFACWSSSVGLETPDTIFTLDTGRSIGKTYRPAELLTELAYNGNYKQASTELFYNWYRKGGGDKLW